MAYLLSSSSSWVALGEGVKKRGIRRGLGKIKMWGGGWSSLCWRFEQESEINSSLMVLNMSSVTLLCVCVCVCVIAIRLLKCWFGLKKDFPETWWSTSIALRNRFWRVWPGLGTQHSGMHSRPQKTKSQPVKKYVICFLLLGNSCSFFHLFCTENCSNETTATENLLLIDCHKEGKLICYLTLTFLISQVIFPSNFEASNGGSGFGHLPMMPLSPIIHPRVKEVRTDLGSLRRGIFKASDIIWMCQFGERGFKLLCNCKKQPWIWIEGLELWSFFDQGKV